MARKPTSRRPRKADDVKAAAERAEKRSKGETIENPSTPIDPVIANADAIKKLGRPSGYKPEFAAQAAKLCRLGSTDAQLADFFNVSLRTIDNWRNQHEDFMQSLKVGKAYADDLVERSLYQLAVGYEYEAVKVFCSEGQETIVPYREKMPPCKTSAIFWLKNRRPKEWRDVWRHEHGQPGDFDNMSDDELKEFIRTGVAAPLQAAVKSSKANGTKH